MIQSNKDQIQQNRKLIDRVDAEVIEATTDSNGMLISQNGVRIDELASQVEVELKKTAEIMDVVKGNRTRIHANTSNIDIKRQEILKNREEIEKNSEKIISLIHQ